MPPLGIPDRISSLDSTLSSSRVKVRVMDGPKSKNWGRRKGTPAT